MRWRIATAILVASVGATGLAAALAPPLPEVTTPAAPLPSGPLDALIEAPASAHGPTTPHPEATLPAHDAAAPALDADTLLHDAPPLADADALFLIGLDAPATTTPAPPPQTVRAADTTPLTQRHAAPAPTLRPDRHDAPAHGPEAWTPTTDATSPAPHAPSPRLQTTTAPDAPHALPAAHAAAAGAALGGIALLAGLGLYHRIRPNTTLENETRKLIFDAVCAQPGLGVHAIAQRAGVSYSTTTYHLERLVAAGMIVMTPDGNKLCYYKNGGAFTEAERRILPILKNEEASRLLDAILDTPGTYRAELAARLGVTATTINWHLKRLRDAGLVHERREGRNAYLFVDATAMSHTMGSLANKVPPAEGHVLDRARRYAQATSGTASS